MGLDYSYLLYFKRERLWDALQGLAGFTRPSKKQTVVVFPDHILLLPLEPWYSEHRMVKFDAPQFPFTISIYFQEDEAIREYVMRNFREHYEEMSKESPLGFPIGIIYLTVYRDLQAFNKDFDNTDLVLMEFGTTGTRMSLLFAESRSIRKRFEGLLEAHQGVYGILNLEGPARLIWCSGHRVDYELPDAFMKPEEIGSYLLQASSPRR
ncbi:MAG: hypothetical protein WD751_11000 [Anaerolineales bacterium]